MEENLVATRAPRLRQEGQGFSRWHWCGEECGGRWGSILVEELKDDRWKLISISVLGTSYAEQSTALRMTTQAQDTA